VTKDFHLITLIRSLTSKQREVLGQVFIGRHSGLPEKICQQLERKGLVNFYPSLGYYLDYYQNYAYCAWCAEQDFKEEE
jgi:hypothetical protein